MASIWDYVYAVCDVRDVPTEKIMNILMCLDVVGFQTRTKREGAVLPYINVDALPYLDELERELLKYAATGKPLSAERPCAHAPIGPTTRWLCYSQFVCIVCVMQDNRGVVRWDLGGRDRRSQMLGTGRLGEAHLRPCHSLVYECTLLCVVLVVRDTFVLLPVPSCGRGFARGE